MPEIQPNAIQPRKSTTISRIIAVGNNECDTSNMSKTDGVEVFCQISRKWKFLKGLKCHREGCSAVIHKNKLFILGGYDYEEGRLSSVSISKRLIFPHKSYQWFIYRFKLLIF